MTLFSTKKQAGKSKTAGKEELEAKIAELEKRLAELAAELEENK